MSELKQFCRAEKIPINVPFNQLSRSDQQAIIEGRGDWAGVRGFFDWMETKKYKLHVRVFLSKYRGYTLCPDCGGGRLRQEARDVRVGGKTLPEVCALSIKDAADFFETLQLSTEQAAIAERILFEVRRRLRFLVEVGPGLSNSRSTRIDTLRRRSSTNSTRDQSRVVARRRPLRARRALDRFAPARQRSAHSVCSRTCATSATRCS